jgi:surface antigen
VVVDGIATADSASANTITYGILGYPWPGEPCEFGDTTHTSNSSNPECVNPKNSNVKFDWGLSVSGKFQPYRNGYEYDNCTDFVQWRVDSSGGNVPLGLGSGGDWYANAPSADRKSIPEPGYVAVSPSYNHVAYIQSVNSNGTITVQEYNADERGNGDTQTGTPASMGFTEYLNFGGTTSGNGNGSTSPPPSPFKPNYLAAETNADGTIELFAVGTDHEIYIDCQTSPNTDVWNGWMEINANADSVAVAKNADGRLEEFIVGSDGAVFYRYQQTPSTDNWSNE